MESFYVDLNEMSHKKTKLFRIWAFGAIFFIILAVLSFILLRNQFGRALLTVLIMAVYFTLYIYFAWITYKAKLYIQADRYTLKYSFGMIKQSAESIMWDTIVRVKLGPTYVAFFKRTGKRKVVALGWLPYVKVIEIKDNIEKFCKVKGITCERSEFKHYEKKKKL